MNRLIFQVNVGNFAPAYYQVCKESVEKYCKKYNIDHEILTEPVLKIRPRNSKRSENAVERLGYLPIYEKENAFSADRLAKYDQICIIDSDIFIRDCAPNIFDELDDDVVFAGVIEQSLPNTPQYFQKILGYSQAQYGSLINKVPSWPRSTKYGIDFYNMGLMLFSNKIQTYLNGETPEQFIRRKEFEGFVNGEGSWRWSTDQTLLNYWVRSTKMPVKNLDWRWNALFKGVRDEVLKDSYFIHFFLSNNLPQKGAEIPRIVQDLDRASEVKYGHR
ncbi:MAG: hypothetical protein HC836_40675 [Richelia sp. RM2_1_2]|nr:hypothetical protein [Richelia sp. RM2_1_2]